MTEKSIVCIKFIIPKIIMSLSGDSTHECVKNGCVCSDCDNCRVPPTYNPEIRCTPSPCVFDSQDGYYCSEGCLRPDRSSRSSTCGSGKRSASPSPSSRRGSSFSGYEQYQRSLLEVPMSFDYGTFAIFLRY